MATIKPQRVFQFVLVAALFLCALIFAGPVEALLGGSGAAASISRLAFFKFCHQDPARSFVLAGVFLPVCARCAGAYIGFFLGWLGWHFARAERRDRPVANLVLFAGLAPLVLDGALNTLGFLNTPAWLRCATGLLFGLVAARSLWPALVEAAASLPALLKSRRAIGANICSECVAKEKVGARNG